MKYIYLEFWIRQFITKSTKKTSWMDTTRYCIGIVHQYLHLGLNIEHK